MQSYFKQILADRRISPEEYSRFEDRCKSLSVDASFDPEAIRLIDKFRLLWQIENDEIPIIANPGIILQKHEVCYYAVMVDWYENRKQTTGVSYGGLTYR